MRAFDIFWRLISLSALFILFVLSLDLLTKIGISDGLFTVRGSKVKIKLLKLKVALLCLCRCVMNHDWKMYRLFSWVRTRYCFYTRRLQCVIVLHITSCVFFWSVAGLFVVIFSAWRATNRLNCAVEWLLYVWDLSCVADDFSTSYLGVWQVLYLITCFYSKCICVRACVYMRVCMGVGLDMHTCACMWAQHIR